MATVTTNGLRISYDDRGSAEPTLLFLPGWCVNRTVFHEVIPLLARKHRCLSLDWRGHGDSQRPSEDFGADALVADALSVVKHSGAKRVVPVALSHAGWIALELRRRLQERVAKVVCLDWLILGAPRAFYETLQGLQSQSRWRQTLNSLLATWMHGVTNPELIRYVQEEIGAYAFEMWARAAREIEQAYKTDENPLRVFARMRPAVPVLHVYAAPNDAEFLAAQQSFALQHHWFRVHKLNARSHFSLLEAPDETAEAIEHFLKIEV